MDLLLWRHAEAVDGSPDHARELTERGRTQASNIACWLRTHGPQQMRVLSSPAIRARQTAEAFSKDVRIVDALGAAHDAPHVLAAVGWPDEHGAVLVVGHQPTLGELAALLLSGQEAPWTIKKGALWWFTSRVRFGEAQTVLRAVVPPDLA